MEAAARERQGRAGDAKHEARTYAPNIRPKAPEISSHLRSQQLHQRTKGRQNNRGEETRRRAEKVKSSQICISGQQHDEIHGNEHQELSAHERHVDERKLGEHVGDEQVGEERPTLQARVSAESPAC